MDIVILSHFCDLFDSSRSNRFIELALRLSANHSVEIITTDFAHEKKRHYIAPPENYPFKITFLHEIGYSKNVCLKRIISHYGFARNVDRYLEKRAVPDVLYCAIPSIDAPYFAAKYCRRNGVRFVIDVQDLWPEAFKMVFHIPILSDIIFYPMNKRINSVYAAADSICAVSQTYADRALSVNTKCTVSHSVYLGTQLELFDSMRMHAPQKRKPENEIWLAYIGMLGHSYDLTGFMDALAIVKEKRGINNVKFIVMGDGPLQSRFEEHAKTLALPVIFMGRLPYAQMIPQLCACDIAVNAISHGAAQSITNKVGDYAAAGLPVINTQESPEYRNLISDYNIGINCENGNIHELAISIERLLNDNSLRKAMGANNRHLAEKRFDRASCYQELIAQILG